MQHRVLEQYRDPVPPDLGDQPCGNTHCTLGPVSPLRDVLIRDGEHYWHFDCYAPHAEVKASYAPEAPPLQRGLWTRYYDRSRFP